MDSVYPLGFMIMGILAYPLAIAAIAYLIFAVVQLRLKAGWRRDWGRVRYAESAAGVDAQLIVLNTARDGTSLPARQQEVA
jgi:hypothetical protein